MTDFPDLSNIQLIQSSSYKNYEVELKNFDEAETYYCENGLSKPEPALFPYKTVINPKTNEVNITGSIVYICAICKKPVFADC